MENRLTGALALMFAVSAAGCMSSARVIPPDPSTAGLRAEPNADGYSIVYLARPKSDPREILPSVEAGFKQLGYEVVTLGADEAPEGSQGTGFIITTDGYLLTCDHVVKGLRDARVWLNETRYEAQVVARDEEADIALLKIKGLAGDVVPMSFRREDAATLGEEVFSLGYPLGQMLGTGVRMTKGHVSAVTGLKGREDQVQVSAEIQPGNSGGPLFDSAGNVIGMAAQTLNPWAVAQQTGGALPQNVNFGLKSSALLAFLKDRYPGVYGRVSFDSESAVASAQQSVVRVRGGLISEEREKANKLVVFMDYQSFFDIWIRFRYFVLTLYDYETREVVLQAGQVGDNALSSESKVVEDTFEEIRKAIGRARKK